MLENGKLARQLQSNAIESHPMQRAALSTIYLTPFFPGAPCAVILEVGLMCGLQVPDTVIWGVTGENTAIALLGSVCMGEGTNSIILHFAVHSNSCSDLRITPLQWNLCIKDTLRPWPLSRGVLYWEVNKSISIGSEQVSFIKRCPV